MRLRNILILGSAIAASTLTMKPRELPVDGIRGSVRTAVSATVSPDLLDTEHDVAPVDDHDDPDESVASIAHAIADGIKDLGFIPVASAEQPVRPTVEINRRSARAIIRFDLERNHHMLVIYKRDSGGILYQLDNSSAPAFLPFTDKNDLKSRVDEILEKKFGRKKPNIHREVEAAYGKLKLASVTVLDLPVPVGSDAYYLRPLPPPTYWLVNNNNEYSLYCLGFVQTTFDLIFGAGAAGRVGLHHADKAEDLKFTSSPVTKEEFDPKKHYSKGTIIRFTGMTHVGIVLDDNKIAHLVEGELYIEEIAGYLKSRWSPARAIIPNENSFQPKSISLDVCSTKSLQGRKTLRGISRLFEEDVSNLFVSNEPAHRILTYIEETLYELNRDAFEIVGRGRGMKARLKEGNDRLLRVPKEWGNTCR